MINETIFSVAYCSSVKFVSYPVPMLSYLYPVPLFILLYKLSTVAGRMRRGCPPWGFLAIAREPFAIESWNLYYWRPIQGGHHELFSFSGQIRSLTFGVISKPPHGHIMSQLRNAANDGQSFSGRWNFRKVTNSLYSDFVYLGFIMWVIGGEVCHVTSPIISLGGYWKWQCGNINDVIRTQTHQMLLPYATVCNVLFLIFAFSTLYDVTDNITGVILGQQRFSSITSDHIEKESRKAPLLCHWVPNRLICNLTP